MADSLILDNLYNLEKSSTNRKRSTRLPHMEVRITVKQSIKSDWISASESLLE
jgi:hypothetical protein